MSELIFVWASSGIFGAYAEGPSAGANAEAAHMQGTPLAGAAIGVEASLCKAGVRAGPLAAEFNPNLNTGASISTTHVEADLLGFGFSFGTTSMIKTPLGSFGFRF